MTLLEVFNEVSIKPQNIKELRDFILDLAVRGKLTEKWRLENPLDIDVKLDLKTVVNIPFETPNGWSSRSFDQVCDFNLGKTPPSKDSASWGDVLPWVSIADMISGGTVTETKKCISEFAFENTFKNNFVSKGTLLMSFKLTVGKVSILGIDAVHNEAIISIYPGKEVLQDYLFITLPVFVTLVATTSAIKGKTLNKSKIKEIPILVPSLEEQKEIVRVVNELFQEIDNLSSKLALASTLKEDFSTSALRELTTSNDVGQTWNTLQQQFNEFFDSTSSVKKLRETILQLAVQGKLTAHWREEHPNVEPASELLKRITAEKQLLIAEKKVKKEKALPKVESNNEVPNHWIQTRLGEIGNWGAGATPLRSNPSFYGGEINWYKSGELNDGVIRKKSNETITALAIKGSSLSVKPIGSVLIAMYGATIGKTAILGKEGATNQAVCACEVYSGINNEFLLILLKSLKRNFISQGEGGAQPNISRVKIRNQQFALPPYDEQKAIVEKVNSLMTLCDQLEEAITLKEEQVTLLMKSCVAEALA